MKPIRYIVPFVWILTACASSQVPIDDAYYWSEDSYSPSLAKPQPDTPPAPKTHTTAEPAIEYTNVQDTTVTIRIKR